MSICASTRSNMSQFAVILRKLLDDTNLFNRGGWAYLLGTSTSCIEEWVTDVSIPSPHHLSMLILALQSSSDIDVSILAEYYSIANVRATTISPHGALMLPTVDVYCKRPQFSELMTKLVRSTPEQRTAILLEMYPEPKEETEKKAPLAQLYPNLAALGKQYEQPDYLTPAQREVLDYSEPLPEHKWWYGDLGDRAQLEADHRHKIALKEFLKAIVTEIDRIRETIDDPNY